MRDKVSRAQRYLPRDCDPPTVTKADADATPILMVTIQSDKRSLLELSEIADLTVKEQLQTINNVSGVQIWGEKRYSMRLPRPGQDGRIRHYACGHQERPRPRKNVELPRAASKATPPS